MAPRLTSRQRMWIAMQSEQMTYKILGLFADKLNENGFISTSDYTQAITDKEFVQIADALEDAAMQMLEHPTTREEGEPKIARTSRRRRTVTRSRR